MTNNEQTGINFDLIKVYLFKGLRYWYIPLITIVIGIVVGYYYARYDVPNYEVNGRVLVKDEYASWGQEYFLPGMELVSSRNRLVNEIGIIRTFPLMLRVVNSMPELHISYYDIGNIKSTELYKSSPFVVNYNKLSNKKIYNKRYFLRFLNEHQFALSADNFEDDKGKTYTINKPINLNDNVVTIKLPRYYEELLSKTFMFQFNNPENLARYYQNSIGINPEDEESSILIMSLKGKT
ncbi:MAG: hypothetical protein OQJ88_05595, partial [Flavobacteriales bacterium]|nr:hypothetical protein [Flavobacteriales bacterium]